METPIRPRTLYIYTKLHGVTFKKNAEILVYSLNLDAKSERQIKCDPYRGFMMCVLRFPSVIGIAELRKLKCDWHLTCKLWFQIYTSHTSWFHSGASLTHWFQTKTSLSPCFQSEVSRILWFQSEKSLTRHSCLNFFISKLGFSFRHF